MILGGLPGTQRRREEKFKFMGSMMLLQAAGVSLGAEARVSIVEKKMGSTIPVRPRAETSGSQHREEKVVLVENMGRCGRGPTSIWQRSEVRLKERQTPPPIGTSLVLW